MWCVCVHLPSTKQQLGTTMSFFSQFFNNDSTRMSFEEQLNEANRLKSLIQLEEDKKKRDAKKKKEEEEKAKQDALFRKGYGNVMMDSVPNDDNRRRLLLLREALNRVDKLLCSFGEEARGTGIAWQASTVLSRVEALEDSFAFLVDKTIDAVANLDAEIDRKYLRELTKKREQMRERRKKKRKVDDDDDDALFTDL